LALGAHTNAQLCYRLFSWIVSLSMTIFLTNNVQGYKSL